MGGARYLRTEDKMLKTLRRHSAEQQNKEIIHTQSTSQLASQ